MPMTQRQALEAIVPHRGERIVVSTMSSAGIWPMLSNSPFDFAYIPSAMGHGPSLGLGLALAQPKRGVIVLNGDGCALMSLGNLVTLAHHPANIHVLILDNGHYEVTGGQAHAGAGNADFAALRAAPASIGSIPSRRSLTGRRAPARRSPGRGRSPFIWWSKRLRARRPPSPRCRWPSRFASCNKRLE